jgi:hypothetical protein
MDQRMGIGSLSLIVMRIVGGGAASFRSQSSIIAADRWTAEVRSFPKGGRWRSFESLERGRQQCQLPAAIDAAEAFFATQKSGGAPAEPHSGTRSFLLDKQPITALTNVGAVLVMTQRAGQTLTAVLLDGSMLSWRLSLASQRDFTGISSQALLHLHIAVPEPTQASLVAVAATLTCCFRHRIYRPVLGG